MTGRKLALVPLSKKVVALQALHEEIRKCQRCSLWAARTQAVPGVGPADARVMLVGEAPGRQEDLQGQPFVGQAGRFLDVLLASIGLARGEVYITNVVKSRPFIGPPPGRNRSPLANEIQACRKWLDEELRIIQPEIVAAMGRIAVEYFLPGKKIAEVHGSPQQQGARTILPLYHPALARYGEGPREMLIADFLKLGELIRVTAPKPTAG